MGRPNYRGPIETVADAMAAGAVLRIRCPACGHGRSRWAWLVYQEAPTRAATTALRRPVPGFRCQNCNGNMAVITAAQPW